MLPLKGWSSELRLPYAVEWTRLRLDMYIAAGRGRTMSYQMPWSADKPVTIIPPGFKGVSGFPPLLQVTTPHVTGCPRFDWGVCHSSHKCGLLFPLV